MAAKAEIVVVLKLLEVMGVTFGHGMLWDPPNRSSLWRFGYETPVNYDDNQHYCGGYGAQISGKLKCGICGDAYEDSVPRSNENGGLFGLGIITRTYRAGSTIPVTVNLETAHKGHFEIHICNLDENKETEECFQGLSFESGRNKHFVHGSRFHNMLVRLPENFRCDHCVLRWHYRTGNNWGVCEDGTEGLGCGPQEIFRNCADVSIK